MNFDPEWGGEEEPLFFFLFGLMTLTVDEYADTHRREPFECWEIDFVVGRINGIIPHLARAGR